MECDIDKERLLKLEILLPQIKDSLEKILETQESFTILKLESEKSKEFREKFDEEITKKVNTQLESRSFENDVRTLIENEVITIFNKEEIRNDFNKKVDSRIETKWKSIQLSFLTASSLKIITIASSISIALTIAILKGFLNV